MIRKHTISFKHAFEGLVVAFSTQPNYRIHLFLSILSIIGGIYFQITSGEFLVIGLLITVGLVIETINTAIEETCDAIDKAIRPDIKVAKDTAAAAMLIFAIGSALLAGCIFIPRIIHVFL
jgi:diacylglycerol kinase